MLSDEHVFDQLPAYALGSMEPEEARQVEKHLESCSLCRAELLTYQNLTGQIGLATAIVEPPAALRQRIMQIAEPKVQAPALASERPGWVSLLRSWFSPLRLAGLAVLLALVASNLVLLRQVQQLQTASQAVQFKTIALAGTTVDPQAQGVIVVSSDGKYGTLVVENLPPLDAKHQYQLWLIKNGQRTSGGVFSTPKNGYTSIWVYSKQPLGSYTGFGITIEPAGGSPQPTGEKVMGGSL